MADTHVRSLKACVRSLALCRAATARGAPWLEEGRRRQRSLAPDSVVARQVERLGWLAMLTLACWQVDDLMQRRHDSTGNSLRLRPPLHDLTMRSAAAMMSRHGALPRKEVIDLAVRAGKHVP